MAYETYGQINGVIREIQRGDSCCSQILRLDTENGEVRFTVMADTMVIENVRLRRGMRVAAFYDTSLPVPAIYPPQYRAEIVTVLRGEQNVMLNFFDENLVAEDNSLRLNLSPVTNIMTQNGQSEKHGVVSLLYQYDIQHTADDNAPESDRNVRDVER